jgi:two-component system chemotaxis response regulator CheY
MRLFMRDPWWFHVANDRKKRVMVVDDASLVRLFYRDTLERAGFEVDEAMNGLEALEKLLVAPVDLLIVDVNMPQMDGFTFLSALRRRELPLASIPALVTSTESGQADFVAARAAGANFYLVKPVDREQLVECARMLCGIPQ